MQEFKMMKNHFKCIFVLSIVLLNSCAYFNIYFNAKRYYKLGYHETLKNRTGKVTGPERTNYQRSAAKASKLIEMYPESKYVDDALLLMAKCFYYSEEYLKGQRKLIELKSNFPESEFIQEADLWMAKSDLALRNFPEATDAFKIIIESDSPVEIKGEANYFLGELQFEQRAFQEAVGAFQRSLDANLEDLELDAMFNIGVTYDSLGMYEEAADYFQRIVKANPISEFRFQAEFNFAIMIKKQRQYDEAIRLLERLLGDEANKKWLPDIELELAECLALKGETDDAILAYQDIVLERKKSAQSAEAYYRLGEIYEEQDQDYDRALDSFSQVKLEFRNSELADSAETKSRDIQRLQALRQVIRMVHEGEAGELVIGTEEVEEDSLTDDVIYTMIDSASTDSLRYRLLLNVAGKSFVDSVMFEQYPFERENRNRELSQRMNRSNRVVREKQEQMDWREWIQEGRFDGDFNLLLELRNLDERRKRLEKKKITDNPELKTFRPEELDKNLFLLAELYLFRFLLPDSALIQYHRILDQFPESPFASQALYNLSYIAREIEADQEKSENFLQQLLETYPDSYLSNIVRENRGLTLVSTETDTVELLFQEAEQWLFEQRDPVSAFKKYGLIWESFPESEFAPKAAYAMGWIGETHLDSLQLAFTLYDSLINRYPETIYATRVKKKVDTYVREKKREEEEKEKARLEAEAALKDTVSLKKPVLREEGDKSKISTQDSSMAFIPIAVDSTQTPNFSQDDSTRIPQREMRRETVMDTIQALPIGGINAIRRRLVLPSGINISQLPKEATVKIHIDPRGKAVEVTFLQIIENVAATEAVKKAIMGTSFRAARLGIRSIPSWLTLSIPLEKLEIKE